MNMIFKYTGTDLEEIAKKPSRIAPIAGCAYNVFRSIGRA
jgi:hypothetical protein